MSNSVRPHRRQPTRLHHPWDSPGKNTGVGCHFLLQCMIVKSESEVAQLCLTLSNPMDWSLLGSSIHGVFQAKEYWNGVWLPSLRKTSTSALLTMPKPLTVWITTNWEILQELGIPDHLTCLLRNLYAGQEAIVRTGTWNNRLVPNRKRSMSRLYIVTLLI